MTMPATARFRLHAEKSGGFTSSTTCTVGDVPGHEIAQRVSSLHVTSDHPDFDGFFTTNFVQADEVDGVGAFWGYALWPLPAGESLYIRFRSNTRREVEPDGSWRSAFEGTLEFLSGTGKYERIAGSAHYIGAATAAGSYWDANVDITY
ncbi:MAG: hypothetical protein NFCOHLIN_02077 [Gammaproteobacteria bacterium]|nr:hypothetical protein [Gammaproteobacteria bacterium]